MDETNVYRICFTHSMSDERELLRDIEGKCHVIHSSTHCMHYIRIEILNTAVEREGIGELHNQSILHLSI